MTPAFWDTSALVPLCVRQQQPSSAVRRLLDQHSIVVWWATSVEMRSAFERLRRTAELAALPYRAAGLRLMRLRRGWRAIQPGEALRSRADTFLASYPLKAADAMQLSAAWIWCMGTPQSCTFISSDLRLLEAAENLGFSPVTA